MTLNITLPDSLYKKAMEVAEREQISVERGRLLSIGGTDEGSGASGGAGGPVKRGKVPCRIGENPGHRTPGGRFALDAFIIASPVSGLQKLAG
jgi:hypothetical protein